MVEPDQGYTRHCLAFISFGFVKVAAILEPSG